ncbi:IncA protein [Kordia sp. SMS9]|uniref:hypothetical protein n=1 Tax=Kordia sp. SMS9 TaxID=2282170 RepID=UPI000E0D455F|nr:hypothetical protein [Kordia sp. SMS9]AXG69619.1 IncA protein [Kordia sp. SMS9]
MDYNQNFGGSSELNSPSGGTPLSDIESFWIQKAINDSSDGGKFETYKVELENEFSDLKMNSNMLFDSRIANLSIRIVNDEKRLEELKANRGEVVKASRRAKKTHNMEKLAPLKRKKKAIEREIRQLRGKILTQDKYLQEAKKQNSAPTVRLSKYFFWGVCSAYVLAASFFNIPIFAEIFGDQPIFIFAAPIFGIVEGSLIHLIGLMYGIGNKKIAKILAAVSGLTLLCLIIGQLTLTSHGIFSSVFLIILFVIGVITSYIHATSYFERRLERLRKKEGKLLSKLHKIEDDIKILETKQDLEADNNLDKTISDLERSITDNQVRKSDAEREKQDRSEILKQTESNILKKAKSIFDLINNFEN